MNWLDVVLLFRVVIAVVGGDKNGLIKSVISLVALIIAVVLAVRFYPELGSWLQRFISNQTAARAVAFVIIFLAVMVAGAIAALCWRNSFFYRAGLEQVRWGCVWVGHGRDRVWRHTVLLVSSRPRVGRPMRYGTRLWLLSCWTVSSSWGRCLRFSATRAAGWIRPLTREGSLADTLSCRGWRLSVMRHHMR